MFFCTFLGVRGRTKKEGSGSEEGSGSGFKIQNSNHVNDRATRVGGCKIETPSDEGQPNYLPLALRFSLIVILPYSVSILIFLIPFVVNLYKLDGIRLFKVGIDNSDP